MPISPLDAAQPNGKQAAALKTIEEYADDYLRSNWPGVGPAEVALPEYADILVRRQIAADYKAEGWRKADVKDGRFGKQTLVLQL